MAGLMNFVELIGDTGGYFDRRHQMQQEAERRKQTESLLSQYRGSQAVSAPGGMGATSSPQSGIQGLLAQPQGVLPPQFYQDMGALSGNDQYLLQGQTGQQAMDRQTQGQQYDKNNMSAYQSGNLQLGRDELAQRAMLEQQRMAQLQASMQGQGGPAGQQDPYAGLPKPQAGTYWGQRPDGSVAQIPVPGSDSAMAREKAINVFQPALDLLRKQREFQTQHGYNELGGDARQLDTEARLTIIPALTALYGSGKLDENEYKRYVEQVHQFSNPTGNLFKLGSTPEADMQALYSVLQRGQDDEMALQGIPVTDPGQSWEEFTKTLEPLASQKRRGSQGGRALK